MKADWLNDQRFNSIDERKKKYLVKMLMQMEGKSTNEGMKVFLQTSKEMKKEGLNLTQDEGKLMIEYLMSNMSPEEKSKWNKISAMLQSHRQER